MGRRSTTRVWFLGGVTLLALGFAWLRTSESEDPPPASRLADGAPPAGSASPAAPSVGAGEGDEVSCQDDALVAPTGHPVGLTCAEARAILREIRERFAADVPEVVPTAFAESLTSWLDPHGLWSASADAPTAALIADDAVRLLAEMSRSPTSDAPCAAAGELGGALERWIGELGATFDAASAGAPTLTRASAGELAAASAFEDGDVTVPAQALAAELGRRLGSVSQSFEGTLEPFVRSARERFLPALGAPEWQRVVLAAAVRSYVSVVDPHGAWAPLDEEWSLYADDPTFDDEGRLWGDMLRTALGVRVVAAPAPPLELDDLVLSIDGVPTVGLSVEQVEQLARADTPGRTAGERALVVLRRGEDAPRDLVVAAENAEPEEAAPDSEPRGSDESRSDAEVSLDFVPYGRGNAEVITIRYVGDDLGDRLAAVVAEALAARTPPVGILLDLRGNGGGSTDGAAAALGVFVPGVPAFPLLHRGHVTEVLAATAPAAESRWSGPVAALVDGATASAAEMLAGGLAKYRRGTLLGQHTYGKGCVQEYFRDHAGIGVMRLTTRLYTLPDGSAVQRRGLVPDILVGRDEPGEREADLRGSLEPVAGPDVRVPFAASLGWPPHAGRIGPCPDSTICSALRKAAGTPIARARPEQPARKRRAPRPSGPLGR